MTEHLSEGASAPVGAANKAWPSAEATCACPGAPCEHTANFLAVLPDTPRRPVTLAMADELDRAGLHGSAEIARKYAVDKPRWWHRFRAQASARDGDVGANTDADASSEKEN